MANLPPGDPKLVAQIVNHLKSQGLFDQFRRDCLADVDTKPAYQNLRQRVDNFVANHLANHTWSPHLNKNQLRNNIRQQVLKSGMLESGIDRIISQVVDPKINHIFRPQVEKVVHEFLANLNGKDDVKVNSDQNEERYESCISVTGPAPIAGPSTSVASDAMSILETISSLNQEATAARALTETSNHKINDKTGKKLHTQQSVDSSLERDQGLEDTHEAENPISDILAEGTEIALRQEGFNGTCPLPEDVHIFVNDALNSSESKGATIESEEQNIETDTSEKKTETAEKAEKKEEKKESRPEKRNDCSKKSDDGTKTKEEKYMKERDHDPETIKHSAPEKSRNKQKTDASKEESASLDSDMDAFSDVTVSSVHTSDLSSFDEESEDDGAVSESTEEGEITSDDEEEKVDSQSNAKSVTDQSETKPKATRHAYIHKPFLYSKYYSDSDDELTVEQRRQSVAKAKEERLLRRQMKRERLEEKRRLKALEKNKSSKSKFQGVEHKSSKGPKAASIKEVLKEQMFLEKKVAISKKRKRHMRVDKDNLKQKDNLDEDSKDSDKTNESCEKMILSTKETKQNTTKYEVKPSRNLGDDSRVEKEHRRKTSLQLERSQLDSDAREARKVSEKPDPNPEDQQKYKNVSKPDRHAKKESGEVDVQNTKTNPKKEPKLHKNGRERTYSDDHSSSKRKYKMDNIHKAAEESDLHRSKKNSKEDDNLQKRSQSKSSSEERSDRKSKHKSDEKSSVEKTPSTEHKTDGISHKDSSKRERLQSTDRSKSDHRYKRSLSDSRQRRDSQGSSREHSVTQKRSKNDVDSANPDNSKQEDGSHKDKRIRQISEDRALAKAIFKSNSSRPLKVGDQEESSQKSDKDKSSLGGHMEKHRKSKSEEKDREDRVDSLAQSSNSAPKESSHKSKHSGEKGKERSRSEHREHSSSKSDKKYLGEKSSNSKHNHKDAKRKEDNSKQQEKPGKHADEKRLQERGSSSDTKSNKKATGEMKGESSRAAVTKKAKLESENEGFSAAGELAKVSTSLTPTESKELSFSSNAGRPDESSKYGRTANETKEGTESAATDFVTESNENIKGFSLKSKPKNMHSSNRSSNASRNISPIIPTLDFHETKDLITLKLPCAVDSAISMSISDTRADASNGRVCKSRSSKKSKSLENRASVDVPQANENENPSSEQSDNSLEPNVSEPSKMSPAALISELTGSSDAEISTSDITGEEGNNVAAAITASSSATPTVSVKLLELDNAVSGNDVEEDSVMDTIAATTESSRTSVADEDSSHCGVEDNNYVSFMCTERNVESSVKEPNDGETRQHSTLHSEMGPNTPSFRDISHMECEDASTSSRPRENAATSSVTCVGTDSTGISGKGNDLTFQIYGENTLSTSAEADILAGDADVTELSENSFEDATTTSCSYSTNDNEDSFSGIRLYSERTRENAATSSQGVTEALAEDGVPVGNITMKAATSSAANRSSSDAQENAATSSENTEPNMNVISENVIAHAATSSDSTAQSQTPFNAFENGITNAATSSDSIAESDGVQRVFMLPVTSSDNAEESNDAAPGVSENVTTHAATSSSSMINSSGELNAEGSLVSSENDNENSAASSSSVMDSCTSEDSRAWLKTPAERDENAASSSSTVPRNYRNEHENNNFSHVEDSKNARATSSTQIDGAFEDQFMEDISSGTLKEYSVNSSDIPMDSSTEASDPVDRLHCSSSGRMQSHDYEKDINQEKAKDNNTASSSSALAIGIGAVCQGPVVHHPNGGEEAASSSSSYMDSSTLHRDVTLNSENPEASSSIAMNSSSEQIDVSVTCPGNSNDNAATSSSNSLHNRANDIHETKQNNMQASTSSNIAMDSSTGEDLDVEFATDMERGTSTATCSSSLYTVGIEPKSRLSERDIGISASSSSVADGLSKENTDVITCKERLSENAATSSDMMDSSTENNCILSNNSAICASTSTSNTVEGGADKNMDQRFNICCEINSEATAASSSSVTDDNSNNGEHNATSSNYMIGSITGRENLSLTYLGKNEEAASSSGLFSVMKLPGTEEPIGSHAAEHATTSSMEGTNESPNSFRTTDRAEDHSSESDYNIVEAAAESSLAVSQNGICVIVTSDQPVPLSGPSICNSNDPTVNSNDIHDMEYGRTDEKEDAVSSASSEEQKFCCNSSRQERVAAGDGETDSAVTSVGSEVGESLSMNDNCEAFSHAAFGDVDIGSSPVSCPEESAVSYTSGGSMNENKLSEANVDTRVTEHSDSGPSFEIANYETGASVGFETERPTTKAVIEEGEGTVTSTGIMEENYSEKLKRGDQDGESSYSGAETEQSNVTARQETRNLGVVIDDESAITSTGAKEDEDEGEGFVTSTGTASEDSSFSTGTEDNSNSAVMQEHENVTAYAEVVKEEINLEQVCAEDTTEKMSITSAQEHLQCQVDIESTEEMDLTPCRSGEGTTGISGTLFNSCEISTIQMPNMDTGVSEHGVNELEEDARNEMTDNMDEKSQQTETSSTVLTNERNMSVEPNSANVALESNVSEPKGEETENLTCLVSNNDDVADPRELDSNNNEDPQSLAVLETPLTTLESVSGQPASKANEPLSLSTCSGIRAGEPENIPQSELTEDGNIEPVPEAVDATACSKENEEQSICEKSEETEMYTNAETTEEAAAADLLSKVDAEVAPLETDTQGETCKEENTDTADLAVTLNAESFPAASDETSPVKTKEEQTPDFVEEDATSNLNAGESTLTQTSELCESPAAQMQETERTEGGCLPERTESGHVPKNELPEQDTQPRSSEETEESAPVDMKKSRGRKSLSEAEPFNVAKETEATPASSVKTEEVNQPKIETDKRKRGRPPKKRNVSENSTAGSPVKNKSTQGAVSADEHQSHHGTTSVNKVASDVAKTEKCIQKSDLDNTGKCGETVKRRGRPKRSLSSSEAEGSEPEKKRRKSQADEEEEDKRESENEEEADEHKGATTRAASRLEAQRKLPHKPTTRAASKLGSPEPSSVKEKRRKEKSSQESPSNRTARSKTPQAHGTKRGRERSPQVVRTRGQQASEDIPTKRMKRQ